MSTNMWRSNIFPKIHILPNISRNKGNQTMKFGQLIGYNMKNIFLEKSLIKCGKRPLSKDPLSPDPFLKNQNWAYLWINSLKFYTFSFNCMPSWGLAKYIETKLQNTCFYLMLFFLKKKRSGTNLPASFSAWFSRKIFLLLHSINSTNFIAWMPLLLEILGNMCIVSVC